MAKQKSGLGRGLNALFDDAAASAYGANSSSTASKKDEKSANETKPHTNTAVDRLEAKKAEFSASSRDKKAGNRSSEIYISEDALENAKVVSRETRHTVSSTSTNKSKEAPFSKPSNPSVADKPIRKTSVPAQGKTSSKTSPSKRADLTPPQGKGDTGVVPLDKVQPNPDQPRTNFKPEEIEELASSIKKEGLLQPILVRKVGDSYQIIAGERRWQACKKLGMDSISVRFWTADNDKALELALIENIQRSDLNPIEEAYGYKRLMERKGMTQSEVAQTVAKGRSTIANALRLLDLPEEAQQLLFEEKITAGHARAILSIPDAAGRKTLTNKLMEEKLSVRETESIARLLSGRAQVADKGKTKRVPAPASYKKAAKGLTRYFSAPVRVKSVQGKNKIEIQFKDEEELQRIVALIEHGAQLENGEKEN